LPQISNVCAAYTRVLDMYSYAW